MTGESLDIQTSEISWVTDLAECTYYTNMKKMAALDHTVVNHLKLMREGRFTVFSNTIKEVTCVNSTLEELIANDSALIKSFGEPDRDPIVEFHAENFKQEVRAAIISSKTCLTHCQKCSKICFQCCSYSAN